LISADFDFNAHNATVSYCYAVWRGLSPTSSNNNPYIPIGTRADHTICRDYWIGFSRRWYHAHVILYCARELDVRRLAAFSGQESHHRHCFDNNVFRAPDSKVSNDYPYTSINHLTISTSWLQVLHRDWNGAGLIMLGTYGTTTMMINL
jgi:hypothetical protein